ncbi:MAG: long-chain fatty acid--CoA ligase [Deltaproteobacteria bacterium]|nr:long-chain fatty acid--CoA ligase [Deltaproteobacteria bacterium]
MGSKLWHGAKWPEGVAHEVSGYERPLFSILDDAARDYPQATYTIFADAGRTFQQVKDTADRLANFLASRGIRQGDRAAIFLPNLPHYPEIFFGILKSGAVAVTCNPLYKSPELNFQLKDSGARAVFVMDHPQFYPTVLKALGGTAVETVVICNVKSYLPKIKGFLGSLLGKIPKAEHHEAGHFLFDEAVRTARPDPPKFAINPLEDGAFILYTGGTTGVPKGACLSHSNLMSNLMSLYEWVRISSRPGMKALPLEKGGAHTYLGVLPWYHSFGLTLVMLASCATASRVVCIPDPRAGNPPFTEVLRAIERHKVTIVVGVPTIYAAFVNHPLLHKFDLSSIVGCGSGAAPLPVEVIRRFEQKTGAVIFEGYGMTETSPVITLNPTNLEQRKIGSVGLPFPGADVKIMDLETGLKELPQGQDGEIAASGPMVMLGYWQKPEANEAVFRQIDGKRFLFTGDIGHIDEEGFLVITDRKKDMIIVGGFNAYPKEIEEVLFEHPKVALAAVVGVPDPYAGECIKAFVQLKPGAQATEEEILSFCKDKMAGYKRPKSIEFRESLPTSVVGKVLRRVLREEELKKIKKEKA